MYRPIHTIRRTLGGLSIVITYLTSAITAHGALIHCHPGDDLAISGDGICSIREAADNANADSQVSIDCESGDGQDTLVLGTGAFVLDRELRITDDLIISGDGPGRSQIHGSVGGFGRIFSIDSGVTMRIENLRLHGGSHIRQAIGTPGSVGGAILNGGDLTIDRCWLTGARAGDGGNGGFSPGRGIPFSPGQGGDGGSIYNFGHLSLKGPGCLVRDNRAGNSGQAVNDPQFPSSGEGGSGGAIYNRGTVEITDCLIEGNGAGSGSGPEGIAGSGGGVYSAFGLPTTTIVRSLFFGNAGGRGGAIGGSGVTLLNTTISDNRAGDGGGVFAGANWTIDSSTITDNQAIRSGGGIAILEGQSSNFAVKGSLIAGNSAAEGQDCSTTESRTLDSHGFNLLGNEAGCTLSMVANAGSDLLGVDPGLEALGANGGATATHALERDSAAVDAGEAFPCTGVAGQPIVEDQRRGERSVPAGTACDIGAFELDALGTIFIDGFESGNLSAWTPSFDR